MKLISAPALVVAADDFEESEIWKQEKIHDKDKWIEFFVLETEAISIIIVSFLFLWHFIRSMNSSRTESIREVTNFSSAVIK